MALDLAHHYDPAVAERPPPAGPRRWLAPFARGLTGYDMRRLGLNRTTAISRAINRHALPGIAFRRRIYRERFDELLEENGGLTVPPIEMRDGFAIDQSCTLPQIERLLADGEALIERWGGVPGAQDKPFLQSILREPSVEERPALLDFITSSDVLNPVCRCFGFVPALGGSLPRGVRLMESTTKFDPDAAGPWRQSQLYHLDYHSRPTVYVIVALRDIDEEDGPMHFLGRAASQRVVQALGYRRRGVPYRLSDEQVYAVVDPSEVHRFVAKAGSVLFIESSACMHFGSRRPAKPRYQMQYSLLSPQRSDLADFWMPQRVYPVREEDSLLRRMVVDRSVSKLPADA